MTSQEFLDVLSKGGSGVLKIVFSFLKSTHADYCVIGGVAANAYDEAVVSIDPDIVILAKSLEPFSHKASGEFQVSKFPLTSCLGGPVHSRRVKLRRCSFVRL